MRPTPCPACLVVLAAVLSVTACGGAARAPASPAARDLAAYEAAVQKNRTPANPADVMFMTMMIPHHAQATLFAAWARSHGASPSVQAFCERVVVGQRDEIRTMRTWLADHGAPVPPGTPESADTRTAEMSPMILHMPGMLPAERLEELDAARGRDFDRLFLTYMIPHHQGALTMVNDLFASYGGAQDDFVYKLASDIFADQTTEIARMQSMLAALEADGRHPLSRTHHPDPPVDPCPDPLYDQTHPPTPGARRTALAALLHRRGRSGRRVRHGARPPPCPAAPKPAPMQTPRRPRPTPGWGWPPDGSTPPRRRGTSAWSPTRPPPRASWA